MTVQNPSFHTVEGSQLYTPVPGPAGPQGPQGNAGPQGPAGTQGPQGNDGPTGPQGAQGDPGIQGIAGAQGAAGLSVLNGTVAPTGADGVDGDFYINTTTKLIHGPKAAGAWPAGVSLVGPIGPAGPQGPAGTSAIWGAVTGTLADQTDLNTALTAKLAKASNLSDVASVATARTNLSVYSKLEVDTLVSGVIVRPSVVQFASACSNSGTVTLGATPTPGNLLVALGTHWNSGIGTLNGFTALLNVNGSQDGSIIATKVASASDTTSVQAFNPISGGNVTVFEVQNWDGSIFEPYNYAQEIVAATCAVPFGIPRNGSLLVGHSSTVGTNAGPTSLTNADNVGATVTGTSTSGSPRQATGFYGNVDRGGKTITANYTGTPRQYLLGLVINPN